MTIELHADLASDSVLDTFGLRDDARPNVSGDLPTVLEATGPMFRRAALGYDRFQVDTYVQWAEDELATAAREHEHLLTRHVATTAELDRARELLAHSAGGGELLRLSGRIGSMLAAAADEADGIRAEAEADSAAAAERARQLVAEAGQALAEAEAEVQRLLAEAAGEADAMTAVAARTVEEAVQARELARVEAEARLEEVRAVERQAVEHVEHLRRQGEEAVAAARLQARAEIVRMLSTARDERRRTDADAEATRLRLDRDAAARRDVVLQEVQELEQRRAVLLAELAQAGGPAVRTAGFLSQLHRLRGRLHRVAS